MQRGDPEAARAQLVDVIGKEGAGTSRDVDLALVVADIEAAGGRGLATELDVADMASATNLAARALDAFGRIDILVNNAALYANMESGPFDTLAEADWDACMTVNVKGVWNCCKAVVPAMRDQKGGSIINIASLAATYGLPYCLHYTTSKGAVIGMTRGLARELGRYWIRVNAIAPSAVVTEGTLQFFGDKWDRAAGVIRDRQSLKRTLETEDLAGTVIYLASDASKFGTGQTLMVDGGTTFL